MNSDLGRQARSLYCTHSFGFSGDGPDRNETSCQEQLSHHRADEQFLGVGFAEGPVVRGFVNQPHLHTGINIATVVKVAPGCHGRVHRRVCTLRQATVKYDVRLTNDSIALRCGAGYGTQTTAAAAAATRTATGAATAAVAAAAAART